MFSLYGQFYEQTDGMAVISQLSSMSAGSYMEDCVEMALEQVTHKLACWFCYMIDNFLIPRHRPERLERFSDHSAGVHQTITMETVICRSLEGLPSHKVHWKRTYINLNLNFKSRHHPFNKHALLSTLVWRARVGVTQRAYLMSCSSWSTLSWKMGYTRKQVHCTSDPPVRSNILGEKPGLVAFLLYIQMNFACISRLLYRHNIKIVGLYSWRSPLLFMLCRMT